MLDFSPLCCIVEEHEGSPIFIVRLNRPDALNALPPAAHAELTRVWDYFESADHLRVGIITGQGRAFCAGFDLKSAAGEGTYTGTLMHPDPDGEPDTQGIKGGKGFAGLTERKGRTKPIIAAVNGLAYGGGFEIVLACDIVVGCTGTRFSLPEPRVGLFAAAGGVIRLPKLLGWQRAMSIMLTCRVVKLEEAASLGLVQFVTGEAEGVVQKARQVAEMILAGSPESIAATLQIARHGLSMDDVDAQKAQAGLNTVQQLFASENAVEGPAAFAQKRKPLWRTPKPLSML